MKMLTRCDESAVWKRKHNAGITRQENTFPEGSYDDQCRKKMSEVVSEEHGGVRLPLPSDTSSTSSAVPTRIPMRTPRRHHHTFTKQDAIRALERGRLAQERLRAQRLAQRKEAMAAIERRRQAAQEANRFTLAVSVDQYTQNETAFFDRKHKVGDVLAFDRNQQAFEPPTLMPAKELVAKLAEKARQLRRGEEEADEHPDDRENNDHYVNEMPSADEKDYKEHGR